MNSMKPVHPMAELSRRQLKAYVTVLWLYNCSDCGHEETVEAGVAPLGWTFDEGSADALCDLCSGNVRWDVEEARGGMPWEDDPFDFGDDEDEIQWETGGDF